MARIIVCDVCKKTNTHERMECHFMFKRFSEKPKPIFGNLDLCDDCFNLYKEFINHGVMLFACHIDSLGEYVRNRLDMFEIKCLLKID